MLRAVLALGGTAAGLAALLTFKTHAAADVAAAPPATSGTTGTSAPAGSSATPSMSSSAKAKSGSKATQKAGGTGGGTGGGGSGSTRTVTGSVSQGPYGPTQIQLVLTGKKITSVNVLQHTDDGVMSQQIDANALPKLTSETLTAQSARVDAVSGATYTSQGYIASLQKAVDSAGL